MPAFRAALFALDGTVVDTLPATIRAFNAVVEPHLGTSLSESEVRAFSGSVNRDQLAKFIPENALDSSITQLQHLIKRTAEGMQPFPGIAEFLKRLGERQIALGLYTLRDRDWTEGVLSTTQVASYFRSIITNDDGARPYPDPIGLVKSCNQLKTPPGETLFVTDSELELQMAKKAGFLTAGAAWGPGNVDRLLVFKPNVLFEAMPSFT